MKKPVLLLLFLSPAIAELLSGSTPPLLWLNPVFLVFLFCAYSCGVILIREARVRWGLGWSTVFLGVAFGILIEGVMMKTFFNPGGEKMGLLLGYNFWGGVHLSWTIKLIFFHAVFSILLPLLAVDLLWPDFVRTPALNRSTGWLAGGGVLLIAIVGMLFSGSRGPDGQMIPFHPQPHFLAISVFAILGLIWCAHHFRQHTLENEKYALWSPARFGVISFIVHFVNVLGPDIMAGMKQPAVLTLMEQFALIGFVVWAVKYQLYHKNITSRHLTSMAAGSIAVFVMLTPFHELVPEINPEPSSGMIAVGLMAMVFTVLWHRRVLGEAGSLQKILL